MPAFEFTCGQCGPLLVISLEEFRRHRHDGGPPPIRCTQCGGPISIDVIYDFDAESDQRSLPGVVRAASAER
jgi:hypothetical protein